MNQNVYLVITGEHGEEMWTSYHDYFDDAMDEAIRFIEHGSLTTNEIGSIIIKYVG